MAMTLLELQELLDELELRHQPMTELGMIMVGFTVDSETSPYRDRDGDSCVAIALRLSEADGEFLSVFAPMAWSLGDTPYRAAACDAFVAIQSTFKMVKFDVAHGFVFPNVEIPLEDGRLTAQQLQRVIGAVLQVIEKYHVVVRRAIDTGIVSFDDVKDDDDDTEPTAPPAGDIRRLIELVDDVGGLDGGGLDALERLLGGDGVPPVGT
jgi:hypothetical protein